MASSTAKLLQLLCIILFLHISSSSSSSSSSNRTTFNPHLSSIRSFCKSTPYPDICFDSLKLSVSINITPNILSYLLQSLNVAISEAAKLTDLFYKAGQYSNIVEKQKGAVQDCQELHQITLSSLQRSVSRVQAQNAKKLNDARAYLSAALTNKNTCMEGLDSASGPMKSTLVNSLTSTYKYVSNSLSVISKQGANKGRTNRRLMSVPRWLSRRDRRILESSGNEYEPSEVLTVAADGSGNFTTISDAIIFCPNNSYDRTIIYVKEGVYEENVEIPSYKTNIVLLGDGSDITFITGNRSRGDGGTTFGSATVAVSGEGFLARDITIQNTAGPEKLQAVALRMNADLVAIYKCTIDGYQDTLYVHSFRQFYRECNIFGTIDYICGNAAVVFQACNIVSKMPMPGQFTVITAQSRDTLDQNTGISMQNCSIVASDELYSNSSTVKSYLGRPWRNYSTTVVLKSYIDDFIDPNGWTNWAGDQGLDTLYYGEYENYGPGAGTDNRVNWRGYHVMDYYDASNFTVQEFIAGDEWLQSTSFPYDEGI
ncbi:probable pectinesterase/pectinesterase inhibitor 12 [Pyrus x bretschneideri]|uniref:probable pectinesterase/pectinesterase inhibitor 12 n=1 Tax=Pyrus x bretschneideri TaxID=225117 RepID=UPI000510AB7D|nr:probable pectinesterase/pectinesterase inhibitor 12 [Pyrus x bretschneideri]